MKVEAAREAGAMVEVEVLVEAKISRAKETRKELQGGISTEVEVELEVKNAVEFETLVLA